MEVGRIIGKTSTHSFDFAASAQVKKWDYVCAEHKEEGKILAQIRELEKGHELIAKCKIIGRRTARGFLRKPRSPLEPGSKVHAAEDDFIVETLGLAKRGLYIGLLEGKPSVKTYLDPERLLTRHIAVIAKSGAGKSYATGVLIEELADLKFPMLIIDPHGEYSSLAYENKFERDMEQFQTYEIKPKSYKDQIKQFAINTKVNPEAEQLRLPIPTAPHEFVQIFPIKLSNAQKSLLYSILNQIRQEKAKFDFEDLIAYANFTESGAKWGLISAIESLLATGLFSISPTPVNELIKPGQITIINLKGASPELQEIAVAVLCLRLFESRKLDRIPPFFLILEEAHNFAPERGFGETRSSRILRTIASEGRKFGLGLCVISQRPARLDKNILSQCTSQLILQVTNPNDLRAIASSFEGLDAESEREIASLPVGKALLIGGADYPTFVDIRVRKSAHGGRAQITFEHEESDVQKIYAFEPTISKKDILLMEPDVQSATLMLYPIWAVYCSKDGQNFYLIFDGKQLALLHLDQNLKRILLPKLDSLSPMQRSVLDAILAGARTPAEIMLKSGLTLSEAAGIVESLRKASLVKKEGNKIILNEAISALADLKKFSFPVRARHLDLPGEKGEHKISEDEVRKTLERLGIKVENILRGWLPLWQVRTTEGQFIRDALSWTEFKV